MKTNNFTVKRENIYVGEVVFCKADQYQKSLITEKTFEYRSILFSIDDNNFADDLLYDSPKYPIVGKTDKNVILSHNEGFIIIRKVKSIGLLLEKLGYSENLTSLDINVIRETIFSGYFFKKNCELFGFETIANPRRPSMNIYRKVKEGILPEECEFDVDSYGDVIHRENGNFHRIKDSFAPPKNEGVINRL